MKLKKREKKTNINLVVFRTNNKGDTYMMAKPCNNCIITINRVLDKKNYILKGFLQNLWKSIGNHVKHHVKNDVLQDAY